VNVNTPDDFFDKIMPEPNTGCWLWAGRLHYKGYGEIGFFSKKQKAHRVSWLLHKGEIPDGLFVCHKCDTPACVNPDHLFLGDNKDNIDDSVRKKRHASSRKTHCQNGHEYNEENTRYKNNGKERACKACDRAYKIKTRSR
jgi:hypothetical protein